MENFSGEIIEFFSQYKALHCTNENSSVLEISTQYSFSLILIKETISSFELVKNGF